MTDHNTKPTSACLWPAGWVPLGDDLEMAYLVDADHALPDGTPLFARLTYRDLRTVATREGAAMISPDQVEILQRTAAVVLAPVILPPTAQMGSLEWSERHDSAVWAQLRLLGWDGRSAVAGIGKHFVIGAPPGRSWLYGWWDASKGRYWQPRPAAGSQGPHGDTHRDYATTSILVRPRTKTSHTKPASGSVVGSVVSAVASAAAQAVDVLKGLLASDGAGDAKPAGPPPHGWHIAVWEVVESARKAGTFVDIDDEPDFEPEPGDLMILRRGGQDPRIPGQEGHVCRIELVTPRERARVSIDGNHGNMVARVTRRRDDPEIVGYVKCRGGWGLRALARAVSQLGVSEATGHNDGPQIARYFAGATRGGKRTGFVPGWNWCAAFSGWCLFGP